MTPPHTPRRWYQYGEPWGLLAKCNPRATPSSVARHAIVWAIIGALGYYALVYLRGLSLDHWPVIMPLAALFCGFIGGLMEWQLDDSDEESEEAENEHADAN